MHLKISTLGAFLALFCLASCTYGGKTVSFVNDRNADGTWKPTKDVLDPVTGQSPIATGRVYAYKSGNFGVSGSLLGYDTGGTYNIKR